MKKDKKPIKKAMEAVKAYTDEDSYKVDPNGSWTGKCEDPNEKPIQDADDL